MCALVCPCLCLHECVWGEGCVFQALAGCTCVSLSVVVSPGLWLWALMCPRLYPRGRPRCLEGQMARAGFPGPALSGRGDRAAWLHRCMHSIGGVQVAAPASSSPSGGTKARRGSQGVVDSRQGQQDTSSSRLFLFLLWVPLLSRRFSSPSH